MRYRVLALLGLAAVIAYVARLAIGVPAATLQRDLGLDPFRFGVVMSALYWAYAVGQLPAGWLADRWGPKPVALLSAAIWSVGIGLAGTAGGFWDFLAVWVLIGLGQAGLFPACTKLIGAWFPAAGRAAASGALIFSQAVGVALAPLLTATLLGPLTWRETFALYAIPGLVWAAAFAVAVPSRGRGGPLNRPPAALGEPVWRRLVTSGPMLLLCGQQLLRGAAMVFFFTWFPRFLQQTGGLSEQEAGRLTAWPGVGVMLGGLLGGAASDWLLRATGNRRLSRQGVAVVGMTCCAGLVLAAYFAADVRTVIALFTLGAFWGTFGGVSGYSVAIEFGGTRVGTVFAAMNTCGNVGAAVFPAAIGWAVARTGSWDVAILGFAALFAVDAVLWALLNPKRPLFEDPA